MDPSGKTMQLRRAWPWWRWVLTCLSALGLMLSAYLGWHHLTGGSVIGCGGGSSCDQVLSSRWSAIGGVLPVSGLATGAYLAMLLASLFNGPTMAAPDRRLAWGAMLVLAGAAAGSAVWFTIVQKWVIGAFCPYCMATHITGLLLAALVIWQAPRQIDHDSTNPANPRRLIGLARIVGLSMIGPSLAGILAACQVGFTPTAVYRSGDTRIVRLPAMDPHTVPLVGSPDSPYVVSLLFDYQCPHCQKVHSMLDEVIRRYDGKLAFVLCPAPLNSQCNPYIGLDLKKFKDSCELAKVGLAVWVANREAFGAFDHWMFSPEPGEPWQPRSLDAARAKAVELVGKSNFDAALADPWIDRHLEASVRIYGETIDPNRGGNSVPKLVFGSRWVTPEPTDANDLLLILRDNLTVPQMK